MAELMNLDNLRAVLDELARDIAQGYKDELIRNGHYTTVGAEARKLLRSIKTHIEVGDRAYEIQMDLEHYWKYLEDGTRPHWPPPGPIANWIEMKPVIPRRDARGRIPSVKSLEYLIRRKISRVGTEATHDLQKTKDAIIPWYRKRIEEALGHDMENYILKAIKP